jgi:hypothetical protein
MSGFAAKEYTLTSTLGCQVNPMICLRLKDTLLVNAEFE